MTLLVSWLVEGTLLVLLATAVISLVPSSLPVLRHRLWWLTLVVMLALPVCDSWLASSVAGDSQAAFVPVARALTSEAVTTSAPTSWWQLPEPPRWVLRSLACLWGLFAAASLGRLARQVVSARNIVHAATPISELHIERWPAFRAARATGRPVRVATADLPGACAIGIGEPYIIVGGSLLEQLDDRETEAIVLHEYAHMVRYDDVTQLLQHLLVAVVGFHPAVRWIASRIDIEREAACDRLAAQHSGSAIGCARALARAAEISAGCPELALRLAPGASLDNGGLQGRVTRLLSDSTVRPWLATSVAFVEAAVILAAGAAVFQSQPLVEFQDLQEPVLFGARATGEGAVDRLSSWNLQGSGALGQTLSDAVGEPEGSKGTSAAVATESRQAEPTVAGTGTVLQASAPLSETVSSDGSRGPLQQGSARILSRRTGPIIAEVDRVAAREAEQTEHTAALASLVSSVPNTPNAQQPADVLAVRTLNRAGSALPASLRLEPPSLGASGDNRWSQASRAGASVGRSAAAAGQSVGRFFQQQGRAVARRF